MRISDAPSPEEAGSVQPVAKPVAKKTERAVAPGSAPDEVTVGAVALAASNSLDAPEIKLAELRQQYLDGTYQVDSNDLAAKIVDAHLNK